MEEALRVSVAVPVEVVVCGKPVNAAGTHLRADDAGDLADLLVGDLGKRRVVVEAVLERLGWILVESVGLILDILGCIR